MKRFGFALLAALLLCGCGGDLVNNNPTTYCNPIDLDYGWGTFKPKDPDARTSADPVMVYFKDKYYLFATHDIGGYRVSDDLMNWKNVFFNKEVEEAALNNGSYTAPAVAADENYMYFIKLNRDRKQKTVKIVRSAEPDKGLWEVCGEIPRCSDPSLFIDGGRYFVFHGLGTDQSIKCFELDPATMTMIEGSERLLMDYITDVNDCEAGYHFGRREVWDEIEAPEWRGKFKWLPCPEGSWIVKRGDTYYLQFATPGTLSVWYCDVVMTSKQPNEGFRVEPYNPVSLKVGGFIGSAGHSCTFKDRNDNWWEISTMWVGNHNPFERRLGLFPVHFDEQGRMSVKTTLGDLPMVMHQENFDASKGNSAGWWLLSKDKVCTASSTLEGFPVENASDENVRTWWSAASGDKGEWLTMDLGAAKTIRAIQLNFAEQDWDMALAKGGEDYTAYKLYWSLDGEKWSLVADRSKNKTSNAHDYLELKEPLTARYLKVVNYHAIGGGKFGMRDLRVFGHGGGEAPAQVQGIEATRCRNDKRFGDVKWEPVEGAEGYLVRFGIAPDYLNQTIQVNDGKKCSLALHILTKGVDYYYTVDAYNENGLTEGAVVKEK